MKRILLTILLISTIWSTAQATDYSAGDTTQQFLGSAYHLIGSSYTNRVTIGSNGGTLDSIIFWADKWYGNNDSIIGCVWDAPGTTLIGRSTAGVTASGPTQEPFTGSYRTKISFVGSSVSLSASTVYWIGIHTRSTGSGDQIAEDTLSTNVDSVAIGAASVPLPNAMPSTTRDKGPGFRRLRLQYYWHSGGGGGGGTPSTGAYKAASTKAGTFK